MVFDVVGDQIGLASPKTVDEESLKEYINRLRDLEYEKSVKDEMSAFLPDEVDKKRLVSNGNVLIADEKARDAIGVLFRDCDSTEKELLVHDDSHARTGVSSVYFKFMNNIVDIAITDQYEISKDL